MMKLLLLHYWVNQARKSSKDAFPNNEYTNLTFLIWLVVLMEFADLAEFATLLVNHFVEMIKLVNK